MNRERFPGIARSRWARFDGPGGSQMVDTAVDAMAAWMRSDSPANLHGAFAAAEATEALVERARVTAARLLRADPAGVVFGPSMTALTWRLAEAVGQRLRPGDEIVCTRLDHDANVSPWLAAAARAGATVRLAEPDVETLELPVDAVTSLLTDRTRWVAVTAASNVVGTVPDVPAIVAAAHRAGARVMVDAVHATPHRQVDAGGWGCDALACSAYKWFGPHVGVLCLAADLVDDLPAPRIRPAPEVGPGRWEQGTLPFESLAGLVAAVEYVEATGYDAIHEHEQRLLERMVAGLEAVPGVRLLGHARNRTPTVYLSVDGVPPGDVARVAAEREVAVGDGDFYAIELARFAGVPEGAVRAGALHYNDEGDVDRVVEAVAAAAGGRAAAARATPGL